MPPKKDDKKGKGAKIKAPPKEIDKSLFKRQPISYEDLGEIPIEKLSGNVINIDNMFPEWDISNEDWNSPIENDLSSKIQFPAHIKHVDFKSLKSILIKEVEDASAASAKGGKKDAPKKGAVPVATELTEQSRDSEGNLLPKMFLNSNFNDIGSDVLDDEALGRKSNWDLYRFFTPDQLSKKLSIEEEANAIAKEIEEAKSKNETVEDEEIPVFDEAPVGLFKDPLICKAFELTESFIVTPASNSSDEPSYLWKSIWPKLSNGRPCYNPSGKYCVRLFFVGKWRKVTVSDIVPIAEDGSVAIASSSQRLELWPTILAKAIYCVYSACGYSKILNDLNIPKEQEQDFTSDYGDKAVLFLTFALHLLNGWTPSKSKLLLEKDTGVSQSLSTALHSLYLAGTPFIKLNQVPGVSPAQKLSDLLSDNHDYETLKTKKNFMKEYQEEASAQRFLVEDLYKWEDVVKLLDSRIKEPRKSSYFFSKSADITDINIFPILAVASDKSTLQIADEINDSFDMNSVKFLVKWHVIPKSIDDGDDNQKNKISAESSKLTQTWVSLQQLLSEGFMIHGCCALNSYAFSQSHNWQWTKPIVAEVVDPKAKGKAAAPPAAKKGESSSAGEAGAADAAAGYEDRGIIPSTILRIYSDTEEAEEKVEEQEGDTNSEQLSTDKKAVDTNLSIAVSVYTDLHTESTSDAESIPRCIDNVVIKLQELNMDGNGVIGTENVLEIELKSHSLIPLTHETFYIQSDKIIKNKIYLVQIISTASYLINFYSNYKIHMGKVDEVLGSLTPNSVRVREGEMGKVRPDLEHLIVRVPVKITGENNGNQSPVLVFFHTPYRVAMEYISLVYINSMGVARELESNSASFYYQDIGTTGYLAVRIHTKDKPIASFKWKLTVCVNSQAALEDFPPPYLELPPQSFKSYFSPNNSLKLFRDKITVDKSYLPLAFKLSINDSTPSLNTDQENISEPSSSVLANISQDVSFIIRIYRKVDKYLIREIKGKGLTQLYMISSEEIQRDLPEGVSLTVQSAPAPTGKDAKKDPKKDAKSASSGVTPGAAPPVPGSGDLIELIFDCILDKSEMNVPDDWLANYPFTFDNGNDDTNSTESEQNTAICKFQKPSRKLAWNLDILGGFVNDISHDIETLELFASIKNSWENADEGRSEKARAAYAYYMEKKNIIQPSSPGNRIASDILLSSLSTVNELEIEQFKDNENERLNLPEYSERIVEEESKLKIYENDQLNIPEYSEKIVEEESNLKIYLTQEMIEQYEKRHMEETEKYNLLATSLQEKFKLLNQKHKELADERMLFIIEDSKKEIEENMIHWKSREAFRIDVQNKNKSLKYLIDRAAEAREEFSEDGVRIENKGKDAKGKKK